MGNSTSRYVYVDITSLCARCPKSERKQKKNSSSTEKTFTPTTTTTQTTYAVKRRTQQLSKAASALLVDEILLTILEFQCLRDVGVSRQVCRKWYLYDIKHWNAFTRNCLQYKQNLPWINRDYVKGSLMAAQGIVIGFGT
eukprot:PhF_6_TR6328/c0_g1_i1/m.9586